MSISRPNIKKLDTLWSTVVKEKANYKCEHCGVFDSRQEAAHVVGRRYRATRWGTLVKKAEKDNVWSIEYDLCGHCLCHVCHQHYDEHGPREPDIVRKTIGKVRQALIQQLAQKFVAKEQEFDNIQEILSDIREANDDSPYSKEKAQAGDTHSGSLF